MTLRQIESFHEEDCSLHGFFFGYAKFHGKISIKTSIF
jgi:hypothetical protein